MKKQKNLLFILVRVCILLALGTATGVVFAQKGNVVSSYGPINQTQTFEHQSRAHGS